MLVKVVDGQVIFASHFVRVQMTDEINAKMIQHQREPDGIVCYSDAERQDVESKLAGISFTTESQIIDPAVQKKAQGIEYASRSEALDHLINNKQPHSRRMPDIEDAIAAIKKKIGI